jgi:subtilisin family serine protease
MGSNKIYKTKPKVKKETDYSYVGKLNNKLRSFYPRSDVILVTFQPGIIENLNDIRKITSLPLGPGINFKHGFATFLIPPDENIDSIIKDIENNPAVANVIPALVDDEDHTRYFLPDEFTVQFSKKLDNNQIIQIIKEYNIDIVIPQRTYGYYTLGVPADRGLFEMINIFLKLSEVVFSEPSEAGFNDQLEYIPPDPYFPKLWGFRNIGQTIKGFMGKPGSDIKITYAWNIIKGNPKVIIVVIDTGADLNHSDLRNNFLDRGTEDWNFAEEGSPIPQDDEGHGTHITGTIAAVENNQLVLGITPQCKVMNLRIDLRAGLNTNRADAINYVIEFYRQNPDFRFIINCSWRMNGDHEGVRNAIRNAIDNNILVIAAAGNSNKNIDITSEYPAIYDGVIAVAATDQRDRKASFSNYGNRINVSAPGENIYSTILNGYGGFLDGTSMATPHVCAVAALIWSSNLRFTSTGVKNIIENTCDEINSRNPNYRNKLGKGRINAFKAVSLSSQIS